jgi:glyoxylase-like metal-dependent hydrolase (beta-lactamase superfamily II)
VTAGLNALTDPVEVSEAGVHRIEVPTPFRVGPVNAYLIEDDPLTLVDSGPNSATSLDVLDRGLRATRHRIEDLELIVVTRQHMDHLGLVDALA